MMSTPKLQKDLDPDHVAAGGSLVYKVTIDGRWIGWVGDTRPWRGHRYGGQQWWACWREEGDLAARWNSMSNTVPYRSRQAAVAGLAAQVVAVSR